MNLRDESRKVELQIPPESAMLREKYRQSGLTVADIATATALSVGTINIALSGIRYRNGEAKAAVPPDRTLVKLASVLRIDAETLRSYGRHRAAELLMDATEAANTAAIASDLDAQAIAAGRILVVRQVLGVFSTDELRAEIERREVAELARNRDQLEADALERDRIELARREEEDLEDLAATQDADRWPI